MGRDRNLRVRAEAGALADSAAVAPKVRPDLSGKVIVVTGANSGIGLETSAALAEMGATVVMTARSRAKGEEAVAEVRRRSGSSTVELADLDLASFASIRAFAASFLATHDRLDVLVCNAGLMLDTRTETTERFETMFGVNHVGHFLLTDLLLDRLKASAPSRIIVLSSLAHRAALGGIDRADLDAVGSFSGFNRYAQSKLANAQFAFELARRLEGTGVTANAVHPGSINSGFAGDGDTGVMGWFIKVFGRYVLRSPKGGAKTTVLLASSDLPRIAGASGGYYSHGRRWRPSRQARNQEAARWLWEETERRIAAVS
jgi:NAD(P)-dependent dehydrogenase (short-subunit alcohol dehydrogenase family)